MPSPQRRLWSFLLLCFGFLLFAQSTRSFAQLPSPPRPPVKTLDAETAKTLRTSIESDIANHKGLDRPVLPDGTTYLYMAVGAQDPSLVRLLLENGASAQAKTPERDPMVLLATVYGNPEIVEMLIKHGADPNTTDGSGNELLLVAILMNNDAAIDRLLRCGANVNASGTNGFTPLMLATMFGKVKTIEALLAKGAQINARADEGLTALKIAQKVQGYEHIVTLLKRHGAN